MKRFLTLIAALTVLATACGSSPDENQDPSQDSTDQSTSDLRKAKRCGPIANGDCPSGYYCDMSGVPAGNAGGTGTCKKEHHCVLNGIFMCPRGESFDTSVCHCR